MREAVSAQLVLETGSGFDYNILPSPGTPDAVTMAPGVFYRSLKPACWADYVLYGF